MQLGAVAMVSCGVGCLAWIASLVGGILGIIGLSQHGFSKTQATIGLILNGLFFLLSTGFMLFSMVVSAANQ
ncbi:MAG: hypothetical protein R3B90_02705 [Planctomycetaceae bacterium]